MATSPVLSNPLPTRGQLTVDAREYGLNTSSDCGPALQAAHDAALVLAAANSTQVEVFVPAANSAYTLRTPVYLDGGGRVTFAGERDLTRIQVPNELGVPAFIVGFPR